MEVYPYVYHDNDFDKTLVTVYSYTRAHRGTGTPLTIIERTELPTTDREALASICDINYLKPGAPLQRFMTAEQQTLDITDQVFDYTDIPRIAIVVYVYYIEFWQEIYNYISLLAADKNVDIFVYMCTTNNTLDAKKILQPANYNSNTNIILNWTGNKGRDVRSFLTFVKHQHYKKYDYICKIHTKKTTYLHDNWRTAYLDQLLTPRFAEQHIKTIEHNKTKISSCKEFLIYERFVTSNANYKSLLMLSKILNVQIPIKYDFFAGTMFWCSSEYCERLDDMLDLGHLSQFEPEPIKNDGDLPHAWERIFNLI